MQLADLNLDLQELNSAMGRVEADAAASADEKKQLRREYEQKIEGVVQQMATLQQQMKQQVGGSCYPCAQTIGDTVGEWWTGLSCQFRPCV